MKTDLPLLYKLLGMDTFEDKKGQYKSSREAVKRGGKHTSRFDNIHPDWIIHREEHKCHETMRDASFSIIKNTSLTRGSHKRWLQYLNESLFDLPREDEMLEKLLNSHENNGWFSEDNNEIFINWDLPARQLHRYSGKITKILRDGFELLGFELRVNVRKDCIELKNKGKWDVISDRDLKNLTIEASERLVSGLKIIRKPPPKNPVGRPRKADETDSDDKQENKKVASNKKEDEEKQPIQVKGQPWQISPPKNFKWSKTDVDNVLCLMSSRNLVDPWAVDFLNTLPEWDNKERVDNLFEIFFKIPLPDDPEEASKIKEICRIGSKSLLFGILDRTFHPGKKHDEMVVLMSEDQGIGKSTMCAAIIPMVEFFKEGFDLESPAKQWVEETMGKVLVEISEIKLTPKNIVHFTSMIAISNETTRLSYRKNAEDYPARHLFIGTTNDRVFLPYEPKGHRRVIALEVEEGEISPEEIPLEEILQIWAEAVYRRKQGETGDLTKEERELVKENSKLFMASPDMKTAIRETMQKFWDLGIGEFTSEQLMYRLIERYDFDFKESSTRTYMRKVIRESRKVKVYKATSEEDKRQATWLYTFLRKPKKNIDLHNPEYQNIMSNKTLPPPDESLPDDKIVRLPVQSVTRKREQEAKDLQRQKKAWVR